MQASCDVPNRGNTVVIHLKKEKNTRCGGGVGVVKGEGENAGDRERPRYGVRAQRRGRACSSSTSLGRKKEKKKKPFGGKREKAQETYKRNRPSKVICLTSVKKPKRGEGGAQAMSSPSRMKKAEHRGGLGTFAKSTRKKGETTNGRV